MFASFRESLLGPPGLILLGVLISGAGAFWAAFQQTDFERELRIRSDKIAELSQNALNSVTGGSSFCYVEFQDFSPGKGQLLVLHNGEYPIYDVEARIVDLDRQSLATTPEQKIKELLGTSIHVGNLTPGYSLGIAPWSESIAGKLRLNIFFVARNGRYIEHYRRVAVSDGWATAIKVEMNGVNVFEKISEKYPRNSDGKVDWQ